MGRIKDTILNSSIGKTLFGFRRKRYSIKNMRLYEKQFLELSATNVKEDSQKYLRLRIIVTTHTIEKGLSHNVLKPGFGRLAISELCTMLDKYILYPDRDDFIVHNAISVLTIYHDINLQLGFDDSSYLVIPDIGITIDNPIGGTKNRVLSSSDEENKTFSFSDFSANRSSVRLFDIKGEKANKDTIYKCVAIAQNAPNACNRQSVRVRVITDKRKFKDIERLQLGCHGFAENATAFAFITNDLSLYECGEFKLPIFEAGIFTMNLVYSLQEENIYTCILNASFPNDSNKEIYQIAQIPKNESINGLLVLYQLKDSQKIKVPFSARRNVIEICTID